MLTAERQPTGEQAGERPGGLWGALSASTAGSSHGDIWRALERRIGRQRAGAPGLWASLAERIDPTRYQPHAIPDVAEEQISEGEQTFTVICSPRGQYLRLTPIQRDLWRQMDGTRTVSQLAMEAFRTHRQLVPVGDLVALLKREGFLAERPSNIYQGLEAGLERRTAEGLGRRVLRALAGTTLTIPRLDQAYGAIYRGGARLLFTPAFLVVWALIVVAGLVSFGGLFWGGHSSDYGVLSIGDSVPLGLAALWAALFVSFVLHESAHALAVKHFGRTIHGGGVMLYYGMPAAFIDTSDIWRSPRRARILVSAAGPMSDLLVASLASLAALGLAGGDGLALAAGALCFKLAVTSYVTVLFNANPLLELDGYFILVDMLRMPDLRRRALAFVRGPLWGRLMARSRDGQPLSREERIMALYGVLTAAYTVFAIVAAAVFWQRQLQEPIFALLSPQRAWWEQLIGWALLLLVIMPILAAVGLAGLGALRAGVAWVVRRGYGRQPALLAAVALLLVLGLGVAADQPGAWYAGWLAPLLWALALGALLALQPDYRGAAIQPALWAMLLTAGGSAFAAVIRALQESGGESATTALLWVAPEALAFVFLLLAGFGALLDVELRFVPLRELLSTVLLLIAAFVAGGIALVLAEQRWPGDARATHIIASAPAYFGALAAALMLPRLFDLRDSRLVWSWVLVWFGTLAATLAYLANLIHSNPMLDTLVAGLWASAWVIHLTTLRQVAAFDLRWEHAASISEAERLARAFRYTYAGCYQLLRTTYGERRARAFDDRMDVIAATADWDVTLDRDRARIGEAVLKLPLDEQGTRFAEVLRYTVLMIEEIAGAVFARRAIQAAYDALPWPERETASRLCFPDTPWARDLSGSFGDARGARLRLLRQVELFVTCDDPELEELSHGIQEQRAAANSILLRAGAETTGVWIVEAGEVIAKQSGEVVAELHRGDTFGAAELLEGRPADRTYRTSLATTLLFIPAEEYRALMSGRAPHAAEALDATQIVRMLERVPLFATMPRHTLRELAHATRRETLPPRSVVVRQGRPSGVFYIIQEGQVAVVARDTGADGQPSLRQVARLGSSEFFGEIELLRGSTPVASVVTVAQTTLLAIPHAEIHTLLLRDGGAARGLEQIGTGRMLTLRSGSGAERTTA